MVCSVAFILSLLPWQLFHNRVGEKDTEGEIWGVILGRQRDEWKKLSLNDKKAISCFISWQARICLSFSLHLSPHLSILLQPLTCSFHVQPGTSARQFLHRAFKATCLCLEGVCYTAAVSIVPPTLGLHCNKKTCRFRIVCVCVCGRDGGRYTLNCSHV